MPRSAQSNERPSSPPADAAAGIALAGSFAAALLGCGRRLLALGADEIAIDITPQCELLLILLRLLLLCPLELVDRRAHRIGMASC